MRAVILGLIFGLPSAAIATPVSLTHQIRALDVQGNPLQGDVPVVITLWSDGASTAPADQLWTDSYTPRFDNGFVSLTVASNGSESPQAEWFADEVWLELSVDGAVIGPRTRIQDSGRSAATASANGQIFSGPGAAFELVEHPTNWAATPTNYNGNISYNGSLGTWTGRPATTAICHELMGNGARMCTNNDIAQLIAAGAVNKHGESDPNRLSYPAACGSNCMISSGGASDLYNGSGTAHLYGDCDHFTTSTSSRRLQRYSAVSSGDPYGTVATSGCNSSYPILCCQ